MRCTQCQWPIQENYINFKLYKQNGEVDYLIFHPHAETDCFAKFLELNRDKNLADFRMNPR